MLLQNNYGVTLALCSITAITEADKLSKYLTDIYGRKALTFSLLKQINLWDISKTSKHTFFIILFFLINFLAEHSILFRGNSMASKIMGLYVKTTGSIYLKNVIRPILEVVRM